MELGAQHVRIWCVTLRLRRCSRREAGSNNRPARNEFEPLYMLVIVIGSHVLFTPKWGVGCVFCRQVLVKEFLPKIDAVYINDCDSVSVHIYLVNIEQDFFGGAKMLTHEIPGENGLPSSSHQLAFSELGESSGVWISANCTMISSPSTRNQTVSPSTTSIRSAGVYVHGHAP